MLLLHGVWSPAQGAATRGSLLLWAETDEKFGPSHGASFLNREHPNVLSRTVLAWELEGRFPGVSFKPVQQFLLLPSTAGNPVDGSATGEAALCRWRVDGALLDGVRLTAFMRWVRQVTEGQGALRVAPDLSFWVALVKWAQLLCSGQQVVPRVEVLEQAPDTLAGGVWRPIYTAGVEEDLQRFAEAMPLSCIALPAFFGRGSALPDQASRYAAVRGFVEWAVDAMIRGWVADRQWAERSPGGSIIEHWVSSLHTQAGGFSAPAQPLQELMEALQTWPEAMAGYRDGAPAASSSGQLVLQLAPRLAGGGAAEARSGLPDYWYLSYWWRDEGEAGSPIAAADIFSDRNSETVWRHEALLRALARAASLCHPIRASLGAHTTVGCRLSNSEAESFVAETAPHLLEAGVIVQLPAWLLRPAATTGVQVRATRVEDGPLSLNSLLSYEWQVAVGDLTIDPGTFRRLVELKLPVVQVQGQWLLLRPEQIKQLLRLWDSHDAVSVSELAAQAAKTQESEQVAVALDVGVEVDEFGRVWKLLQGVGDFTEVPVPGGLRAELRPYQVRGLSWLVLMRELGLGACLADDMGLGKTLQVIALLQHTKESSPHSQASLVICPTTVVETWRQELAGFAPRLKVLEHYGPGRHDGAALARAAQNVDVVITTFGLALKDHDALAAVPWNTVVVDEAQNIKNPGAKQTRSIKGLQATHRVALTGTPVENRLSELWSILDFLNPGYLGTQAGFQAAYAQPIEQHRDSTALAELQRLIRPFILRRSKEDPGILPELPEKVETKVYCTLTAEQAALYEATVQDMLRRIDAATGIERRGLVFAALTRLKQICDHPSLFLKEGRHEIERSGKLNQLVKRVTELRRAGQKALIFTQFAQMGYLLQAALREATDEDVLFLHGGVPKAQRDVLVKRFQSEGTAPLFVLSLRAGGVGLSLTAASRVFHFDRWWNPAVEAQAADRAYRIGQTSDVAVDKLICTGTLEDHIDALMEEKKALADDVIESGERWLSELSAAELESILTLRHEVMTR